MWRIRDRSTFATLRREGRRVRRGAVTVTWAPGDPAEPPRVAYAVGRRVGGAVLRNRIRRRLRATIAEGRSLLRPGAYLIGADPAAAGLQFGELRSMVWEALGIVGGSEPPPGPRGPA
ncbi:MAG: ribonuclease P protein component [Acidimicrobiales bacterium]